MVGHTVTVTKVNGQVMEGVFHTFCPFEKNKKGKNVYVIKGAKLISGAAAGGGGTTSDDNDDGTFQEGSTLLLSSSQVQHIHIKSIRLDTITTTNSTTKNNDDFRTDSEISGRKGGTDRLVAAGSVWTSGGDTAAVGLGEELGSAGGGANANSRGGMFANSNTANWRDKSTNINTNTKNAAPSSSGGLSGTIGNWDQFTANEQQFQIRATFDESLYTTTLDYDTIDSSKMAEAERIAKEIENTVEDNVHLREERGQALEGDYDEEDLYSGVLTNKTDGRGARGAAAGATACKTMNYAAAAGGAKKEAAVSETVETPAVAAGVAGSDSKKEVAQTTSSKANEEEKAADVKKEDVTEKEEEQESKPKLNPNAKEFTFNPGAKSFTPSFGAPAPAAPPVDYSMHHPGMMGNYHPGMQYMPPGGPGK